MKGRQLTLWGLACARPQGGVADCDQMAEWVDAAWREKESGRKVRSSQHYHHARHLQVLTVAHFPPERFYQSYYP